MKRFRMKVAYAALAAALPVLCPAQKAGAPPGAPVATKVNVTEFTSHAVARVALLDLRASAAPLPRDFAIAHELLGVAESLMPEDVEVVRRRAEAAWNAGDTEALLEMTRRIVKLDPTDTVAQLRLITSRIGRLQTAEERLASYDAFVGPKGASLDESVRSRLALDAAMLCRERGDEAGFVERLKTALRLDSTNKDAALLALNFYNSRLNDRRGRLDLLSNLLLADPLDPVTVRQIRDQLAAGGGFKGARRFHALERAIANASGTTPEVQFDVNGFVLDWLVDGPGTAAAGLTTQIEGQRARIRFSGEMDPSRQEGTNVLRPEDVRLDIPFEQIRLLSMKVNGQAGEEQIASALSDLEKTVENRIQSFTDPTRRPAGMGEIAAQESIRGLHVEVHLMRILLGRESDEHLAALEPILLEMKPEDSRVVACRVWRAVRDGQYAVALEPQPEEAQTLWSKLAQAEGRAASGDVTKAAAEFAAAALEEPLNPLGAYAWSRSKELGGDPAAQRLASESEAIADSIPGWIDSIIDTPRRTQALLVTVPKADAGALDFLPVRMTIRNVSPKPLGMGSGRTVNSRFFFGPSLETGVRVRDDFAAGEVVELDRRLRLRAGDQLEADVWPEVGLVGWLEEVGSDKPSRLRWRVIQGFEGRSTGREPGPGCLETSTATLNREALPESRLTVAKLVACFAGAGEDEVPALLVAARCKLLGGIPGGVPDPDSGQIASAIAEHYPSWPPVVRLCAAAVLPPPGTAASLAVVDDLMKKDEDPRVRMVVGLTRTTAPDDPLLAALIASGDARVSRAAAAHRDRLAANMLTYSKVGPQVAPGKAPAK
ncbi:hypothetical protein PHYC_02104 [Phycisphaerales bacterium]|nr:hypothetical protein PHYC_02104 [Phycisphaerales bacterium]